MWTWLALGSPGNRHIGHFQTPASTTSSFRVGVCVCVCDFWKWTFPHFIPDTRFHNFQVSTIPDKTCLWLLSGSEHFYILLPHNECNGHLNLHYTYYISEMGFAETSLLVSDSVFIKVNHDNYKYCLVYSKQFYHHVTAILLKTCYIWFKNIERKWEKKSKFGRFLVQIWPTNRFGLTTAGILENLSFQGRHGYNSQDPFVFCIYLNVYSPLLK